MQHHSFQALLLKKIPLSNDNILLECLTENGKVLINANKLAKSKKKAPELDFFRLLQLDVTQKHNYSLKSLRSVQVFWDATSNYASITLGSQVLRTLSSLIQEDEDTETLFSFMLFFFQHIKESQIVTLYKIRMLTHLGLLPSFDSGTLLHFITQNDDNKSLQKLKNSPKQVQKETEDYLEKLEGYFMARSMLSHTLLGSGKSIFG